MINGAHAILYSTKPDADRAFLADVLALPHVDVGHGWLIFALPPAEVAVHPAEGGGRHELYLMTDDIGALVETLSRRGVACTAPRDLGWGILSQVTLPGGGELGIYQPRHARPAWTKTSRPRAAAKKRAASKRNATAKRKAAMRPAKSVRKRSSRTSKRRS